METGIEIAVRIAGSQTALGNLLGVSPQAVQKWVAQGYPSADACKQIEEALSGQVTRAQLDPYLFGDLKQRPEKSNYQEA